MSALMMITQASTDRGDLELGGGDGIGWVGALPLFYFYIDALARRSPHLNGAGF